MNWLRLYRVRYIITKYNKTMGNTATQRKYEVSSVTAEWLGAFTAHRELYDIICNVLEHQYGGRRGEEGGVVGQAKLDEAMEPIRNFIMTYMCYNIEENMSYIENLNREVTEI